ncbi:siderophore-interacting protein [Cellulomonas sp. KRMCY2]|uniref:siderophore-interacting protein n=1 Tax=Cellulomonas sp. KRMCY2 TaxID=1304865 RepID=UPI00045EA0A1|nr:siderophore-interacting protein [Cellulomonas sp. KRMCY2]
MTTTPTAPAPGVATSPVRKVPLPLVARTLTVRRVEDLSDSLRRIVLAGPELEGFASDGPTDHLKVCFPAEPDARPVLPTLVDGRWADVPGVVQRDYTVRTFDRSAGEVALEMVSGEHGPAARWAAQARPGQELGLLGPRSSKIVPLDRDWYLLAADEAGVPGLRNWLDRIPATARVQAFIEVGGPTDEPPLPDHPRLEVTWLHRGDAAAGSTTLLPDAVAAATFGTELGAGWVWAGGEASAVRAIRRHLGVERGLDRGSFAMTGYWRLGVAAFDHHSPEA